MSKIPKNVLKDLFSTGAKPKQRDYNDWLDSYHHKDEDIPIVNIVGLKSALEGKLDRGAESTLINEFNSILKQAENVINKAYMGIAVPTTIPPELGSYWYKVTFGNVTTFPHLKDLNGLAISTIPGDFENQGKQYDVTIEVKDGVASKEVNERPNDKWEKKTLFSFKRLQIENVLPINVLTENTSEGLNIKLLSATAPFTTQLAAINTNPNNNTDSNIFACLSERSYQKVIFKQNSLLNNGSYPDMGMGLSFVSTNGFGYTWSAQAYLVTNPNNEYFGKIVIQATKGVGAVVSYYSKNPLPNYAVGDVIEFTFERFLHDYIVTARNLTKTTETSIRISPGNDFENYIPFNTSNPCLYIASGDFIAYSWEYGYTNPRQIDNLIIGDSITLGQSAVVEPLRWSAKTGVKENNMISGGGADYCKSVKLRLQEIYTIQPKRVILMIGGNDILLGTPTQEWKDTLDWIVYHMQLQGIVVMLCYPSARYGAGELINYMNTSPYLNVPKIDCNTPTAENGTTDVLKSDFDSGDHLHPNNYGHEIISSTVNTFLSAL